MLIVRTQPHGQPCAGRTPPSFPYTSSVVRANGLPNSFTALCAPGSPQWTRRSTGVISRTCGLGASVAKSLVSTTMKPPPR
jgi:hypothetical protein